MTGMTRRQTIVVGVDGSAPARAAARFAITEAARRGARVVAVQAFEMPDPDWDAVYQIVVAPSPGEVTRNIESRNRAMLRALAEEVGGAARSVEVDAVALLGSPAKALLDQAEFADLLVVGHRGRGPVASAVLGSVGLRAVLHAPCPVTVVPATVADEQPVPAVTGTALVEP